MKAKATIFSMQKKKKRMLSYNWPHQQTSESSLKSLVMCPIRLPGNLHQQSRTQSRVNWSLILSHSLLIYRYRSLFCESLSTHCTSINCCDNWRNKRKMGTELIFDIGLMQHTTGQTGIALQQDARTSYRWKCSVHQSGETQQLAQGMTKQIAHKHWRRSHCTLYTEIREPQSLTSVTPSEAIWNLASASARQGELTTLQIRSSPLPLRRASLMENWRQYWHFNKWYG